MKILSNFNKSFNFIEITPEEILDELKALASDSSKVLQQVLRQKYLKNVLVN